MKRSSDYFASPKRQNLSAILMIIIKTYKVIIRQIWPIVIIFLAGGGNKGDRGELYFAIGIGVVALLAMLYSIINFFKKYYYIDNEELVLESGIIGRKRVAIPFERVQTINFEQSLIHRLLSVVRLKADTAGSVQNEFMLDAISQADADLLREVVMEGKKALSPSIIEQEDATRSAAPTQYQTIMSLGIVDLLKAGIVENHFRSFGIIIAIFFGLYENLQSAGMNVDDYTNQASEYIAGLAVFVFLALLMAFISFMVSMIRMILTNYNLRFLRFDGGFKVDAGLLTQRSVSALDPKIQTFNYSDNLLQKLLELKDIKLEQAGSQAIGQKKAIKIPGCNDEHIKFVTDTLYPNEDIKSIETKKVDKRMMYRQMLFYSLVSIPFFLTGWAAENSMWIVGIGLLIYLPLRAILQYRKLSYGFSNELLLINGGAHGDKKTLSPIYKLQAVQVTQSPYQRRKDLASVTIHHAAGKDTIPYIPLEEGRRLANLFLYKVERDGRPWM